MGKSIGAAISVVFLLSACAPQYAVKTHYILPADMQGKACVQVCSSERKICKIQCDNQYEHCLAAASKIGKESYRELKQEYWHQLSLYERAMARYDSEMSQWSSQERNLTHEFEHFSQECSQAKKRSYVCRKAHEVDDELHGLHQAEPPIPLAPRKPVLLSEVQRAAASCSRNCGCGAEYDSCFVSCGGGLHHEKYCIENCE